MSEESFHSLRQRLDECHEWPCTYTFKFIAPTGSESGILQLFEGYDISRRFSKGGKYVSITAEIPMPDSNAVISIYKAASEIDGVLCL